MHGHNCLVYYIQTRKKCRCPWFRRVVLFFFLSLSPCFGYWSRLHKVHPTVCNVGWNEGLVYGMQARFINYTFCSSRWWLLGHSNSNTPGRSYHFRSGEFKVYPFLKKTCCYIEMKVILEWIFANQKWSYINLEKKSDHISQVMDICPHRLLPFSLLITLLACLYIVVERISTLGLI